MPPDWDTDFMAAIEVYRRTTFLSGIDMNGYPQLTKLEFVLEYAEMEIEDKERFLYYIEAIHGYTIRLKNETR